MFQKLWKLEGQIRNLKFLFHLDCRWAGIHGEGEVYSPESRRQKYPRRTEEQGEDSGIWHDKMCR